MTQLLDRAFAVAASLPEMEQDAIASLLLSELESERQWSASFAASQSQLAALADEALREFEIGETESRLQACQSGAITAVDGREAMAALDRAFPAGGAGRGC